MAEHNIYRNDKVHVLSRQCATCIFRPGNLMHLNTGRVKDMLASARSDDGGSIVCHATLGGDNAICRGFYDLPHKQQLLQLAERLGVVRLVEPPDKQS